VTTTSSTSLTEASRAVRPSVGLFCLSLTAFTVLLADAAAAHPGDSGHGSSGMQSLLQGIIHPITGIDHLLAMVAVGVLAATSKNRKVAWFTPVGFLCGMTIGGLLGVSVLSSVALPGAELAIALSVVLLGVFIATLTKTAGWWLPISATVFGAFHGLAHGVELPSRAIPVSYVAGFLIATALLHVAGAGIGVGLRHSPRTRQIAAAIISSAGIALLISI